MEICDNGLLYVLYWNVTKETEKNLKIYQSGQPTTVRQHLKLKCLPPATECELELLHIRPWHSVSKDQNLIGISSLLYRCLCNRSSCIIFSCGKL